MNMWNHVFACEIERIGDPGNYTYSVASDRDNHPVNFVNFWNTLRFANWLNNGQGSTFLLCIIVLGLVGGWRKWSK
jgi:hypothetical protein